MKYRYLGRHTILQVIIILYSTAGRAFTKCIERFFLNIFFGVGHLGAADKRLYRQDGGRTQKKKTEGPINLGGADFLLAEIIPSHREDLTLLSQIVYFDTILEGEVKEFCMDFHTDLEGEHGG